MTPNPSQSSAFLRSVLMFAFAYAAGKGWLTTDQANGLVPLILDAAPYIGALAAAAWGIVAHRDKANIAAVNNTPGVVVVPEGSVPPTAVVTSVPK